MNRRLDISGAGPWRVWPALLVLLAAVLVPTACVLWFMNAAMRNERLGVRERLTDVYRQHLTAAAGRLDNHWAPLAKAVAMLEGQPPGEAFDALARSGLADGAVICDAAGPGAPGAYPAARFTPPEDPAPSAPWEQALGLEFQQARPADAAAAWADIAKEAKDANLQARALQGQARCLAKAGEKQKAIEVLTVALADERLRGATDTHGRLIVPDCHLLTLQLMGSADAKGFAQAARALADMLSDYRTPMPSDQRRFLMSALDMAAPGQAEFPTLPAEALSADYVQAAPPGRAPPGLSPSAVPTVWRFASPSGRVVALLGRDRLEQTLRQALDAPLTGASVVAYHGQRPADGAEPFLSIPAGQYMPDWRLLLYLDRPDPFTSAARQQHAVYLWTAGLGIFAIAAMALLVAAYVGRQMRLARLKNDLIATVSHELKTPLSSIRVLVDTLLEGRCTGPAQANEYFRLIGRENQRLSRLIDNFLTFSRMERRKRAFEFAGVDVNEVVTAAVESMQDRLRTPGCRLTLDLAADLSPVRADRDALVTVVLNLLDNAWKYSAEPREIAIGTRAGDGAVRIEVRDNGIGISRRALRRIFDRFYQADQTLARKAGGCGLGLSIVKFIVDAHGGGIDVTSQPGAGSAFTVRLPANWDAPMRETR